MKRTVYKGLHFPLPYPFPVRSYSKRWEIEPIEYKYDVGEKDQEDWNKLCGLKECWNTHRVSMINAWRWMDGAFEIMPYQHDEGLFSENRDNREFHSEYISGVDPSRKLIVEISNWDYEWHINAWQGSGDDNLRLLYYNKHPKSTPRTKCFRVENYFGGNNAAPNRITFDFK